jgi:hypothetical protein
MIWAEEMIDVQILLDVVDQNSSRCGEVPSYTPGVYMLWSRTETWSPERACRFHAVLPAIRPVESVDRYSLHEEEMNN